MLVGTSAIAQGPAGAEVKGAAPSGPLDTNALYEVLQYKARTDAEAEIIAAQTKQKLAEQQVQSDSAQKAVSDNAKLLRSGITVGVGLGVQFPLASVKGTSMQLASLSAMPYVAFAPAYWGDADALEAYCASSWGGGGESDAAAAAMEVARRKAANKLDALLSAMNAGAPDDSLITWASSNPATAWDKYEEAREAFLSVEKSSRSRREAIVGRLAELLQAVDSSSGKSSAELKAAKDALGLKLQEFKSAQQQFEIARRRYQYASAEYVRSFSTDRMAAIVAKIRIWRDDASLTEDQRETSKNDIIRWMAEQEWNSSLRGRCRLYKLGLFVGLPIGSEVQVKVSGSDERQTRDHKSRIAFGFAFTPNAYISVLLGASMGVVERQGPEGTPRDGRTMWSGVFSLGGNFDLAAALLKGAQSLPK
ncbi:hypothetical protein [Melittangium boletus]|uniref:hypothetical protein n=1 Tax=Melittangium boletus TaxID=83453 RepID=UPI003DA3D237